MSRAQKTPLSRSLSTFAQKKALDEIAKRGLALPGHVVAVTGAIVTVNFDLQDVTLPQMAMPLFGPTYIRYPVQVGDLGVAFPASVYLGGVSGLGGGTADLTMRGNLSTLVWFPIGNKNWATPPGSDANTLALYGKNALELLDSIAGNGSLKMNATGITLTYGSGTITLSGSGITIGVGSHTIVVTSSGITLGPGTTIDAKSFLPHEHSGVQSGGSNTGPVV